MSSFDRGSDPTSVFAAMFDAAAEAMLVVRPDGMALYANPAFRRKYASGGKLRELDTHARHAFLAGIERARRSSIATTIRVDLDGEEALFRAWRTRAPHPEAEVFVIIAAIPANSLKPRSTDGATPVSQIEKERDRAVQRARQLRAEAAHLRHLANTDRLTGLLIAQEFERKLQQQVSDPETRGCLFLLDLDGFKAVNDSYGHRAGDTVLKHVAKALFDNKRAGDLVARLGGDEFAFWAAGLGPENVANLRERLAAAIGTPLRMDEVTDKPHLLIRASIGHALAPSQSRQVDTLLRLADASMYAHKQGRDLSA